LIGSTKGIRIHPKIDLSNINNLQSESIGSQHLSLRRFSQLRTETLAPVPPLRVRQNLIRAGGFERHLLAGN
jgi:hypothetical protein